MVFFKPGALHGVHSSSSDLICPQQMNLSPVSLKSEELYSVILAGHFQLRRLSFSNGYNFLWDTALLSVLSPSTSLQNWSVPIVFFCFLFLICMFSFSFFALHSLLCFPFIIWCHFSTSPVFQMFKIIPASVMSAHNVCVISTACWHGKESIQ